MSDFSYNINLKTLHYQILGSTIHKKICKRHIETRYLKYQLIIRRMINLNYLMGLEDSRLF